MAVTDERGIYRIAARAGVYRLTAELQGFRAVTREGLELLVGQVMTVNLPMLEATAAETVTVTAESPLLNVSTSTVGGNVDPRQVQELPVNSRNWMNLALLAPGSRTTAVNATTPLPDRNNGEAREFQLNMDGQQVSADIGTGGQPRYSQDSIAEFQFVSNRFDATQGRSSGVQVNAITKSGGNRLTGSFRGNFRNSKFNAYNPVLARVEPVDNQQLSTTLGGPLVRDKLHYFVNYEYRARAADQHLEHAVPGVQCRYRGYEQQETGRCTRRLPAFLADSPDGEGVCRASLGAVRARQPAASRRDEYDVRTQQRGARATHAGPEQPRAERGQSRLRVLQSREPQPDDLGQPLAERQWHHHRVSAYYVCGLPDRRQSVPPAAPGPGRLERPRRLHVLVRCRRPSRPANRWRVPAPSSDSGKLPAMHGHGRCQPARSSSRPSPIARPDSAPDAVSRRLRRRLVEPGGDFAAREHLQHRPGRLRRPHGLAESRAVGPGRLADLGQPDVESRASVGCRTERVCE